MSDGAVRWAAGVEYDGSGYSGWQSQRGQLSVQDTLQAALTKVASHPIQVCASGRTDAGVHAMGQVIHFDARSDRDARAWLLGGNTNLPSSVSLSWVRQVDDGFHARFSAVDRSYRYVIVNNKARSALLHGRAAWVSFPLDHQLMHAAAQVLLGEQDFSSFRASECQSNTPIRNVRQVRVWRSSNLVVMDIRANAFLHHMVRNIMGALIEIGRGRYTMEWLTDLLAARDRRLAPATAPACGLYLCSVDYPPEFNLPPPSPPWFPAQ